MEKITAEDRKEAKKLLKEGKIQEFFELFFSHVNVSKFANGQGMEMEMETWTDGGVNMLVWLENEDNLLEDFKEFVGITPKQFSENENMALAALFYK